MSAPFPRQRSFDHQLRFEFKKRRQLFIRSHNETLSVVAMRVNNPDWFAPWNQSLKRSPNSNRLS
jgi:hypothetical protein